MNKDAFTELFEIQVRGTIATAFAYVEVEPEMKHWEMMRGNQSPTLRDIAEIGHMTGYNMNIQLSQSERLSQPDTQRG